MMINTRLLTVLLLLLPCVLHAQRDLTTERSTLFSGAGNCTLCHGPGTNANVTSTGKDVSPPNLWRSSMMANAARDPFWQAVVASESRDLPALAEVIEDKCTNCHAPMGHEEAERNGDHAYMLSEAEGSALAMDGVSCTLCHQVASDNFGTNESFSGEYKIFTNRVTFGPYSNPLIQPMKNISGYEPVYSSHIERAELCATCHTLFTPFVDDQGTVAGEFPEQTPFLEWKHSVYPSQGTTCQTCHIPALEEAIRISSLPQSAPARKPYFQHHFVGGNTMMQSVIRAHAGELGVTATDQQLDSTYARTENQMLERAVALNGGAWLVNDTLHVYCGIENLTGHKFPTGFPSRRAWLHVTVRDQAQRLVFESGALDADAEIVGLDAPFEPHHVLINDPGQVQIYESVMGDVNSQATVELLRAARYLKDNRILPLGFTTAFMDDDTVGVVGAAREDADFGRNGTMDGSGRDMTEYRIAVEPAGYPFTVSAEVVYQSIKPEFISSISRHQGAKTDRMVAYWNSATSRSTIVQHESWISNIVSVPGQMSPTLLELGALYPMPQTESGAGFVNIPITLHHSAEVHAVVVDMLGREQLLVEYGQLAAGRSTQILSTSQLSPGMYLLRICVENQVFSRPLLIAR